MKFNDPYSIVCSTCGVGSKLPVKELLARQARCPSCGQVLTDVSDGMHAALDKWSDYVAAIVLTVQLEEQNPGFRYDEVLVNIRSCTSLIATPKLMQSGPGRSCPPTEWELAARGGLEGAEFAWGDEFTPDGKHMANTWQGEFPHENLRLDGYEQTSPVLAFPPNGYDLYDMIGNVWEWTTDWWSTKHQANAPKACCIPEDPRGGREEASYDPCQPNIKIPRRVVKGGSHLCAPNYCRRYRPAARHAQPVDTSMSHVGFRCVIRERRAS